MAWDYRVVKHTDEGEVSYQIHEVYYDENQIIESWTENSIKPYGETPRRIKRRYSDATSGMPETYLGT